MCTEPGGAIRIAIRHKLQISKLASRFSCQTPTKVKENSVARYQQIWLQQQHSQEKINKFFKILTVRLEVCLILAIIYLALYLYIGGLKPGMVGCEFNFLVLFLS